MSDVVGSAEFELRASRKKLKEDIRQSEADLKSAMGGIEQRANEGSRSIGASIGRMVGSAMTVVTGLVTLLGLAAAGALNLGMQGVKMADQIASTARKIGIGTNALQEWRYVAEKTGGTARDADQALDSFATKLAQAAAGTSRDAVKAFGFLGMGRDQLRTFSSTEEALDHVTDAIKALRSEADRTAVIEALGLGALAPALRDAAVDVSKLRDEAQRLGITMDAEMVRRASQAQDQFDTLSKVIDVQLKSAFVDLIPVVITLLGWVSELAKYIGRVADGFRNLPDRTTIGLQDEVTRLQRQRQDIIDRQNRPGAPGFPGSAGPGLNPQTGLPRNPDASRQVQRLDAQIAERQAIIDQRAAAPAPARTNLGAGGTNLILPPGRTDNSRQREEEREARRRERVEQEIYRARVRALGIVDQEALTVRERYELERSQVELEREAELKELESRRARKDITAQEYNQLKALHAQTAAMEDRVAKDILARDLADERLAQERVLSDLTANLVSLQVSAARTAEERRRLELDLLAITQRQRRQALELQMERERWSEPRRAEALSSLGRIEGAERDAVNRNNLSPLQRWREESLRSAGEIEEAYERVAVNGLGALTDGITDAITGTRTLGEVFASVARQIIADLTRIAVRRAIIEPLANALFPGSGPLFSSFGFGSGNVGSSVLSGLGKAAGSFGAPATPITGLSLPSLDGGLGKLGAGPASAPALRTLRIEVDKSDYFEVKVTEIAAPVAAQTAGLALNQSRVDQANIMRRNRQRFV